jgi:hypothetical protein
LLLAFAGVIFVGSQAGAAQLWLESEDPADPSATLLAEQSALAIGGAALEIDADRPVRTIEAIQPDVQTEAAKSLLVHLVSEVHLREEGAVLLSVSVNGLAALQAVVTREGQGTRIQTLDLVEGQKTRSFSTNGPVPLEAWNFAQTDAQHPGRSLVTFRAERNGDQPLASFVWTVDPQTELIATGAASDELALKIHGEQVTRDLWSGDLRIPVSLTRRGDWEAGPVKVEVMGHDGPQQDTAPGASTERAANENGVTTAWATIAADDEDAIVSLPMGTGYSGLIEIRANASNAFNAPQATAVIRVQALDRLSVGIGALFLFVGTAMAIFQAVRRTRPIFALATACVGVGMLAVVANQYTSVDPLDVRVAQVEPRTGSEETTRLVFSEEADRRFDAALTSSGLGSVLVESQAAIVEERTEDGSLTRVLEISSTMAQRVLESTRAGARVVAEFFQALGRSDRYSGDTPVTLSVVMSRDGKIRVTPGYS